MVGRGLCKTLLVNYAVMMSVVEVQTETDKYLDDSVGGIVDDWRVEPLDSGDARENSCHHHPV